MLEHPLVRIASPLDDGTPMAIRRFHVQVLSSPVAQVTGREAQHAIRVLRLKTGEQVILFDGSGLEAAGRIIQISDTSFEVELLAPAIANGPSRGSLTLVTAVPKGNRADWMVEKLAELGVARLWPLRCDRGQVDPGDGKLARWGRMAIEAAKQSRQAANMTIESPGTFGEIASGAGNAKIFVCDSSGPAPTLAAALRESAVQIDEQVLIVVGPEGGFTNDELAKMKAAGALPVCLAQSILRIETAAIAAATLWATYVLEKQQSADHD